MVRRFREEASAGRGRNVSGLAVNAEGYVLIYASRDGMLYERKFLPAENKVEDFNGTPVSYSQAIARSGGVKVEFMGGRPVNGR